MPYHEWGEKDFDWEALDEATDYLYTRCRQFARLGIWTKEKYGTLRVDTTCAWFGEWPLHNLINPGHVAYRWPRWVRVYIDRPLSIILSKLYIIKAVRWWQLLILKFFWKRAAKKWPQVAEEILEEYSWVVEE